MAFDSTGATVGAVGHDAATIIAALIQTGAIDGANEDAGSVIALTFDKLQRDLLASSLMLQAETAVEQGMKPGGAPAKAYGGPRRASGGGGGNSDPGTLAFRTGKHSGSTIADIYNSGEDGQGYIEWCAAELKNEFMRDKCAEFLTAQAA